MTITSETTEAVNRVTEREIYAQMLINEKPIKFHIDCGATVIVLPAKYVNKEDIQATKPVLKMWNKTELNPEGTCSVTVCNPRNRRKYSVKFIVVEEDVTPLLRAKVIQQMALIEVHEDKFLTKSVCVPLRIWRIVMHTLQRIGLYQRSLVPRNVSRGPCTVRGLRSLAFCCVRLCTCGSACFELVLVSLCCQQFSVVHVRVNPPCLLLHYCSVFKRSFWVVVLTTSFLCFHRIYYISITCANLPFCVGVHGWVARICQPWKQSYLGAGCQKWKLMDV